MTRDVGELKFAKISPPDAEGRFRFLLSFAGPLQPDAIEFVTTSEGAMALMKLLQDFQAKHKLPIPASFRPKAGLPNLSIVESDD